MIGDGREAIPLMGATLRLRFSRRAQDADADRLAGLLEIRSGSIVGDAGAGKGALTFRIADKVVPAGRVFASEINRRKLHKIERAAARLARGNVIAVQSELHSFNFPPDSCDAIFVRGAYHHLADPAAMNRSLFSALRDGGRLAILDFRPAAILRPLTPRHLPADHDGHGIEPELVIRKLTAVGFRVERSIAPWASSLFFSRYCLLLTKLGDRREV
jgi:SAM-dependent methyltransferase